jgi:hypothetical protein
MFIKLVKFTAIPEVYGVDVIGFNAEYKDDACETISLCARVSSAHEEIDVFVCCSNARQKAVNAAIDCFVKLIQNTHSSLERIAFNDEYDGEG